MNVLRHIILFVAIINLVACSTPTTIADLPSHFANVNNTRIHYKTSGKGEQTIVFIHGFGCDLNAWDQQFAGLKEGTRLVFIDLPGYGLSDKPHVDYTLDFFADAVKAVMDNLNIDKAVLVGHSLGTPVCRQFTFRYPDMVAGLCDIDGVYCLFPADSLQREEYDAAIAAFADSFRGDNLAANITAFVESLSCPTTPASVREYALSTMPQTPEYIAYSTMSNLIKPTYWTGELIITPSLIICTQNSGIMPDNRQQMEALYSNMQYQELTDVGHFIMMEKAEWFNKLLLDFFREVNNNVKR